MYDQRLGAWAPGMHTGTVRGNQLTFASGARAVEILRRDDVPGNVIQRERQLAIRFAELADAGRRRCWHRTHVELGDAALGAPP
ncbi:MAG: hypothetical protein ACRDQ5_22215 [Sciscionella sp.]